MNRMKTKHPMRTVIDAVTARALRYGLDPVGVSGCAPAELAQLAHYNRFVLARALVRVERVLAERPSRVAEQARYVLEQALMLATEQPLATASR